MMPQARIEECFQGHRLFGDDFGPDQISSWLRDEAESYANLGAGDKARYRYVYHALNEYHCFRHLPHRRFPHVLGFGAAYGEELSPLVDRVDRITIVDPSDAFVTDHVAGKPTAFLKPHQDGHLDLETGSVHLITCFGVLHHIPNVTCVVHELARVSAPGGYLLLREPITSMGDWRKARAGLTMHERGIPLAIMREILSNAGWTIEREQVLDSPVAQALLKRFIPGDFFNSRFATRVDARMAAAFAWNYRYHATSLWHKCRPCSASFVLSRSI